MYCFNLIKHNSDCFLLLNIVLYNILKIHVIYQNRI